jgi:hypothetical protein
VAAAPGFVASCMRPLPQAFKKSRFTVSWAIG